MIFTEYSKDKKYQSVYKAAQKAGAEAYFSGSTGTSNYHCAPFYHFCWTDAVSDFVKENECVWLLTIIESYLMEVSTVYATFDAQNYIKWNENPNGKDDFLLVFLQKVSESSAVFTIELDDGESIKTIIRQDIDFTDIKIDTTLFYLENGVLIFPEEH